MAPRSRARRGARASAAVRRVGGRAEPVEHAPGAARAPLVPRLMEIPLKLTRVALAVTIATVWAAPAAAARYDAKQNGDVVELADADAQMNVSVVWNMCNAWRIQVKGKDLVRTSATLADFQARPGFNGMPFLAPFANRLDETAFYANGTKYRLRPRAREPARADPSNRVRQRHEGVAARRGQGRSA